MSTASHSLERLVYADLFPLPMTPLTSPSDPSPIPSCWWPLPLQEGYSDDSHSSDHSVQVSKVEMLVEAYFYHFDRCAPIVLWWRMACDFSSIGCVSSGRAFCCNSC